MKRNTSAQKLLRKNHSNYIYKYIKKKREKIKLKKKKMKLHNDKLPTLSRKTRELKERHQYQKTKKQKKSEENGVDKLLNNDIHVSKYAEFVRTMAVNSHFN